MADELLERKTRFVGGEDGAVGRCRVDIVDQCHRYLHAVIMK